MELDRLQRANDLLDEIKFCEGNLKTAKEIQSGNTLNTGGTLTTSTSIYNIYISASLLKNINDLIIDFYSKELEKCKKEFEEI